MNAAPDVGGVGSVHGQIVRAHRRNGERLRKGAMRSASRWTKASYATSGNKAERATRTAAFAWRKLASASQHVLVGDGDLLFERVQIGIAEDLPPFAAQYAVVGLRLLPALRRRFLEGLRHGGGEGADTADLNAAGAEQNRTGERGEGQRHEP